MTETCLYMEKLRLNPHYVIWYKNVATLLVSVVIPFTLLVHWNLNTIAIIVRRRRLMNRTFRNEIEMLTNEERNNVSIHAEASNEICPTPGNTLLNGTCLQSNQRNHSSANKGMSRC